MGIYLATDFDSDDAHVSFIRINAKGWEEAHAFAAANGYNLQGKLKKTDWEHLESLVLALHESEFTTRH